MLHSLSLFLQLLPFTLSAPTPADINVETLKPIQISKFNFNTLNTSFNFKNPNTKVKTICPQSRLETEYTPCADLAVSSHLTPGDTASDFHLSLKETYTSGETYNVVLATKEVTNSFVSTPRKFDVPIESVYTFQPFSIPEIFTFSPSGRPGSSPYQTLNFTITDNNDEGKATTKCTTQWVSGEKPEGEIPCVDPSFTFHVNDFNGIGQFTLMLKHTYFLKAGMDISASGDLTLNNSTPDPNFQCTYGASGVESCGIPDGKAPLKAPITYVDNMDWWW